MYYELKNFGLEVEKQKYLPIVYETLTIENAFRVDLIIENKLILEIKTVDFINDIHKAQVLTYLKMTGLKLGLLLNFRTDIFKDCIKRVINGKIS